MNKTTQCLLHAYEKGYRCTPEGHVISPKETTLKLYKNQYGYCMFSISIGEIHHKPISRAIPVHRLQAYQKFGDACFEKGIHIRHLNGVQDDNRVDNIGIGSVSDNMMDKLPEDRMRTAINASCKIRKFSDSEMADIRTFYANSKSYKNTMATFDITSKGTLHRILNTEYKTKI